MKKTIVGELFIIILLSIVIVITLKVVLFDFIPSKTNLPNPIKYRAEAVVKEILNDIDYEKITQENEESETESVLKSYKIEASDLKNYVSKNDFESGKDNPFDDYKEKNKNTIPKNNNKSYNNR